jgi:hypothetical protein
MSQKHSAVDVLTIACGGPVFLNVRGTLNFKKKTSSVPTLESNCGKGCGYSPEITDAGKYSALKTPDSTIS